MTVELWAIITDASVRYSPWRAKFLFRALVTVLAATFLIRSTLIFDQGREGILCESMGSVGRSA